MFEEKKEKLKSDNNHLNYSYDKNLYNLSWRSYISLTTKNMEHFEEPEKYVLGNFK